MQVVQLQDHLQEKEELQQIRVNGISYKTDEHNKYKKGQYGFNKYNEPEGYFIKKPTFKKYIKQTRSKTTKESKIQSEDQAGLKIIRAICEWFCS